MIKQRTWPSWLLMIGSILWVVGVDARLGSDVWGPPGTAAYERYQWANRLFALPLILFVTGNVAIHRSVSTGRDRFSLSTLSLVTIGYSAMIVGSVAEFWLFTNRSYTDPLRTLSWTIFLLGIPIFLIGMPLHSIAMWRSRIYPRWLALITLLAPISILVGLTRMNTSLVMGLSVWAAVLGIWHLWMTRTSRQRHTSHPTT